MRKDLKEVYANQMVDRFAHSLLMIFVPIYIISIGYSLTESLLVLLVPEIITIVLAIPIASLASKLGLKHAILYRVPVAIIFVLWLESIPSMNMGIMGLLITGVIWGLSRTMYWIPLNSEFVGNSDKSHSGSDVSFLIALPIIVCIGSPSLGGVVLEFAGFYLLFSIFMISMILSTVPFFMTKDYKKSFKFKKKDVGFHLGNRFSLGFFAQGFTGIGNYMLWPLYTYIVVESVVFTGAVASLAAIGTAFVTILIGRVSDKINKEKMLRLGSIGCFFMWILKYFAVTNMEFFILSFMGGVFGVLIAIPLFSSFSNKAKDRNIINDVSMREIYLSAGRAVMIFVLVFSLINLQLGLILIAVMCLPLMLVKVK
jgi:MFS family permease